MWPTSASQQNASQTVLHAFPLRRAGQRAVCAEQEAKVWSPDPERISPDNVQALRFLAKVAGLHVLGIIAEAAAEINSYEY